MKKKGIEKRDKLEASSLDFQSGGMLKEARKKANLTQEELVKKRERKKATFQEFTMN